jgi:M6 family metalloprotease-like protein
MIICPRNIKRYQKNMKHNLLLLILLVSIMANAQRSICPASPYPMQIKQADGSVLTIRIHGNEAIHHKETEEGYTILPNAQGIYEYAILDNNGYLVLSGMKAANQISETAMQKNLPLKHLRFNSVQVKAITDDFNAMNAEAIEMGRMYKGTPKVNYPTMGNLKMLAICMQFPDEPSIYPVSVINDVLNQPNYNGTGSFKDYFIANSYGQSNPTIDVAGWYTTTKNREQYGQKLNSGATNSAYNSNVRELVMRALDSADIRGNVDFTKYDNDKDGDMDGVLIFHAGYGAEQGVNGFIWSHRSAISAVFKDGISIRDYCINPVKRSWNGEIRAVGIGVLTHEWGHIMGLPDLYDTNDNNGSSEGIGEWGLMGSCGWLNQERTPCMLEAWSRVQFGWLDERMLVQPGSYQLKAAIDTGACYRINTTRLNEYYLLENRQRKGFDAALRGRGLAIWHINTQKTSLYPGNNSVNADTTIFGVGLKQADGKQDLEKNVNRGDAGDLYPGTANNVFFSNISNPPAFLHYTVGGMRQPSNISISNISMGADSIIRFKFGAVTAAGFQASVTKGCVPLTVDFTNTSTGASFFEWKFGSDSGTVNTQDASYTFTKPGTYDVTLSVKDSNNANPDVVTYTIIVDPSPEASLRVERGDSNLINFVNTSKGATYYSWLFGTNQTDGRESPTYKLTTPGFLKYRMIAFGSNGCTDTIFGEIDFWPLGAADLQSVMGNLYVYPNPTRGDASIHLSLKNTEHIVAEVYNMLGEKTGEINHGSLTAGDHLLAVAPEMIAASGIYYIKLTAGKQQSIIKLVKQ